MSACKCTVFLTFLIISATALANRDLAIDAEADYVECEVAACIYVLGSEWSELNTDGVAISVAFGTKPAVSDDDIKRVLTRDFEDHGVTNLKFFYEQNDTPATGISFHVRGGTEGIFLIDTVREQVEGIAKRTLADNPVLR